MAAVYAACKSYRDDGVVVCTHIRGAHAFQRSTGRQPFRTLFVRPSRWRFEFLEETVGPRHEWHHYVIWTDGTGHHSWWTLCPDSEGPLPISRLLAGATGVSGGAAHTVPVLLDPEVGGYSLTTCRHAEYEGDDEEVDGCRCAKVRVTREHGRAETLWIDRGSFLLRRVFHRTEFNEEIHRRIEESLRILNERRIAEGQQPLPMGERMPGLVSESTTHYSPQMDIDIEDSEFAFVPPVIQTGNE